MTYAYHDANGRPLRGPCRRSGCPYLSRPGIDACAAHLTPAELAAYPPDPSTDAAGVVRSGLGPHRLGEARQYTVGDRVIEIGWRRVAPMLHGSDYDTPPHGYIVTKTTGRAVKKGEIGRTPAQLRKMAAALNACADALETAQAEYHARRPDADTF